MSVSLVSAWNVEHMLAHMQAASQMKASSPTLVQVAMRN